MDLLVEGGSSCKAALLLRDGTLFEGYSFGHDTSTSGEVVFFTGMVGYPESLTDPSYKGQILVFTYPLIGNYGVPTDDNDEHGLSLYFESHQIQVKGLVIANYSHNKYHYKANKTLSKWLKEQGIPAITGIDTRAVTKHIRDNGSMSGKVLIGPSVESHYHIPFYDPNFDNLVSMVSRTDRIIYTTSERLVNKPGYLQENRQVKLIVVDCGVKVGILRYFLTKMPFNILIEVVPWDFPFADIIEEYDGLFISNGPGDPTMCVSTISHVQKVMKLHPDKPIFGVCLGNHIITLAAGGQTYKMKFGHRGMTQPVVDCRTTRCYITSQNHGYAVKSGSLPQDWLSLFINANDETNEGVIHRYFPWFSVQFHPEGEGGPTDTNFLFHEFLRSVSAPRPVNVARVPVGLPCRHRKVVLLGSGGLTIGQAGEFDYSGSQAIKALKEANIMCVLVNPNIATVQTSEGLADRVYFLPVNPFFVEQVIAKERPDGVLLQFGGQTALNCGIELNNTGVFHRYSCQVLGTPISSIVATEDRETFTAHLKSIGEKYAPSGSVVCVYVCMCMCMCIYIIN
eukprot:GHVR01166536.1.p1 GENE.GHVR01166536.1~~GHVR01166536.1.p1  ORF type:complete len:567 (+),score=98.93 GHVR01166536.1:52-1752(+)